MSYDPGYNSGKHHAPVESAAQDRDKAVVVGAGKRVPCGCKVSCGDVAESDDNPNAVCKGLPFPRAES